MIFYFGFGVLLQGAGMFLLSHRYFWESLMSLYSIMSMSLLYVESGHEQISYCTTLAMKYAPRILKKYVTIQPI
jgi:hypothetical protein